MVQQSSETNQQRLLLALSEELKNPLISIAFASEQGMQNPTKAAFNELHTLSHGMIKLVDAYMLSLRVAGGQQSLNLEPISAGAILSDSAHSLSGLAKSQDCEIILDVSPSQNPLLADRHSLTTAISALGQMFINSTNSEETSPGQTRIIRLSAYKTTGGVALGVFDPIKRRGLTAKSLQTSRLIYGSARQPLPSLATNTLAGLFVADSLFTSMSSKLRIAHRGNITGIAGTFPTSNQLSLV